MKGSISKTPPEPMGIVISGPQRIPQTTVFSAYVWGPAPSTTDEQDPKKA
jgi:hypothetical protein